jgi:hypothetical protein
MNEKLYSFHVFMFPFQWQIVGAEMKNKTMEERTCLAEFVKHFNPVFWKRIPYRTDTILKYNEYNYFYGMTRDVLFDDGKPLDKTIIANLFYDIEPDIYTYDITLCDWSGKVKKYSLNIDSIILHLYSTGVGVLSFHLNNRLEAQKDPDSILDINQAGRRLYPPFFGIDFDVVGTQKQFDFEDFEYGIDITTKKELARGISVLSELNFEDFKEYSRAEHFASNPFQLPKHIAFLFDGVPITVDKGDYNSKEKKMYIAPSLDDRMFVLCWYGNEHKSYNLKQKNQKTGELAYETDEWWYKFMFNDQNSITCQNLSLRNELIKKHTYQRWSDYGTFYGINRYSFVCLTGTLDTLKKPYINAAFLVNHMQTMYYKMAELCLVQRACLLRFSEEVSGISSMDEDKKRTPMAERVGNLYKQYIRFVNRIHFREVTAQDQGIEIYQLMQESMRIPENVKDLDKEIHELYEYVILNQEQKQNRNIELLTIIGAIFIFPAIIFSFFDMAVFPQAETFNWRNIIPFMAIIGLIPFIYLFFHSKHNKKWLFLIISSTILLLIILFTVIKVFLINNFNI